MAVRKLSLNSVMRNHDKINVIRKKSRVDQEFVINVAFMGSAASGKTTIVHRLMGKKFHQHYNPTVFDFYDYESKVDNTCRLSLQISDTAGAFSFPAMDRLTIQKSDVVVVVFDLTSMSSLNHAESLIKDIKRQCPRKAILIIGNKSDQPHRIASKRRLNERVTCNFEHSYIETSAKLNDDIAIDLLQRIKEEFALLEGPYDIKRSEKPFSSKLRKQFSRSTLSLRDFR